MTLNPSCLEICVEIGDRIEFRTVLDHLPRGRGNHPPGYERLGSGGASRDLSGSTSMTRQGGTIPLPVKSQNVNLAKSVPSCSIMTLI